MNRCRKYGGVGYRNDLLSRVPRGIIGSNPITSGYVCGGTGRHICLLSRVLRVRVPSDIEEEQRDVTR